MRTVENFMETDQKMEIPTGISMTLPEQTMSLKTLIERHSRGQDVVTYKGQYANLGHDDLDLEKYNRYDPVDREKIARAYWKKLDELKENVKSGNHEDDRVTNVDDKPVEVKPE